MFIVRSLLQNYQKRKPGIGNTFRVLKSDIIYYDFNNNVKQHSWASSEEMAGTNV